MSALRCPMATTMTLPRGSIAGGGVHVLESRPKDMMSRACTPNLDSTSCMVKFLWVRSPLDVILYTPYLQRQVEVAVLMTALSASCLSWFSCLIGPLLSRQHVYTLVH
jgi:hypothetical protein